MRKQSQTRRKNNRGGAGSKRSRSRSDSSETKRAAKILLSLNSPPAADRPIAGPRASGAASATAGATAGAAKTGLLSKALGPFRKIFGGVRSTLAFGTLFDIFVSGENPIDAIKNNLGGVLIAAIAAPFIAILVAKLGLPILAAGVIKFIVGSIFFGIGKSLFNRFRVFGGKNKQVQQPDTEEVQLVKPSSETVSLVSIPIC